MPTSTEELGDLHRLVNRSLTNRIQQDLDDNIPTDAATLGAAIKFLKDNNVSADPSDREDLDDLRSKLAKQREERRKRGSNVINMASKDVANGG